ncbi:MAG: permease-like cell division protein FtsX [Muribaculaceae bacterium]|nr:permease-like cell division protein FtsX [Muribaculaceae bacterium]
MKKRQRSGIPAFNAQITSTISVSLVLLLLGIVAFLGIATRSVTESIKENMGFDVILKEGTSERNINKLKQRWTNAHYISSVKYRSADDALREWQDETGEDLMELLGVNPFSPEFDIRVKPEYANVDSINKLTAPLKRLQSVAEITVHADMIESINGNIRSISLILIIVAAALMLISFVLINNTIRLTVYSRRFIIHTMKLVGAKAGFIRKPFIISNMFNGIIASLIAMALLSGILYYTGTIDRMIVSAISYEMIFYVFAGILATGIMLCSLAALFATNKYLRISYDDMFK